MIRDFLLIMFGIAIQIFSTWIICKLKKPHPTDPNKMIYESHKYDLPKREWVGLSNGEMIALSEMPLGSWDLILEVEAKLKEKNT
jgi:hypothetical protein